MTTATIDRPTNGHASMVHRLLDEERPDPEQPEEGSFYLPSELLAIKVAAVKYADAERDRAEIDEAVAEAKHAARMTHPTPGPTASRDAALAWLAKKPLPTSPKADLRPALDAGRVLDELVLIATERANAYEVARGELRVAILTAERGRRVRECARYCLLAEQLTEASASAFAADHLLGTWANDMKLDPCGWMQQLSTVLSPPPELRPKKAKFETQHFRDVVYAPTTSLHGAIKTRVVTAAEHQLRKCVGERASWPF